jgi:hypothetical protein
MGLKGLRKHGIQGTKQRPTKQLHTKLKT